MFRALESSGYRNFLGCKVEICEEDIQIFFANTRLKGDTVINTGNDSSVGITKKMFAGFYKLPTEGLVVLSDFLDKLVAQMGLEFSESRIPIHSSNKINLTKESRIWRGPDWRKLLQSTEKSRIIVITVGARHKCQQGITDSAYKNQLVVVSIQYGPFNPYIPIRSTTIGKSRVAKDSIAMHTSWRSNRDIASVTSIGYPRMSAIGESSTTMHRLLHASGSHPIPPPNDPKIIHSTNVNHLESPNEGSSIDHQVTIYLHAQNITMYMVLRIADTSLELGRSYPHFDGPID
ncbi:hypothetical protein F511_24448 [Dorcoceras hygrometricum]|uniref:Uncharacterized protein n=1 Tax=Dorcoceras hygrometricum TaxID=472368 RepID=A0A2Z7CMN3_9LAMI|nr:hypothetical protein F511_24448 [Dorcoceras hygrometricum]